MSHDGYVTITNAAGGEESIWIGELAHALALLRRARNVLRTREYLDIEEMQLAADIDAALAEDERTAGR